MHRPTLRYPPDQRSGAANPPVAAANGPALAPALWPGCGVSLLAIDFQGVYQVNIAAAAERLTMLRFSLSLLAAPFAATAALASTRVVSARSLTSWGQIPVLVFGLLTAFGLLAVLPYLRMLEASIAHARTARALNNFRLLYALQLRAEFQAAGWTPNLPVDPAFPDLLTPFSWPGIAAIALAAIDATYIGVGLAGLARARPAPLFVAVVAVIAVALLFTAYFVSVDVRRRRRQPTNPLGFSSVET